MSRHSLHYLDLNPQHQEEPPAWALILGAVVALLALWACTVVLFTL